MRPTELQILLDLSAAIATVKNKDDLLRLILEKINPVFDCTKHAVVLTVDAEAVHFRLMLCEVADMVAQELAFFRSQQIPIDQTLRDILNSDEAIIFQTEPIIEKQPDDAGAQFNKMLGIKEVIACRLQVSGKIIGVFSLHTENPNHFNKSQLPLFKAVAGMVAIAVNNILANEQLRIRAHQKSQLLKISLHIATIREKEDLFRLIAVEMKSFIDFDDVVIALINTEEQHYSVFLSDVTGTTSQHKDYKLATSQKYPITKGSIVEKIYNSEKPVLVDIESEYFKDPELQSLKFAYNFGMREEIIVRLTYSGKLIGMMGFLSKKRNRYTRPDIETAYSLSSLVAIALNNVLANQELKLREQQKSQLLNISAHISTVRDKNDLFHLLTEEIRSFIDFDNALISTVDEKTESFSVFVADIDKETMQHQQFTEARTRAYPITKGNMADQVIQSEIPMIIDIKKELFKNPELELRYSYDFGFRENLITKLTHSGKVIGVFVLFSKTQGRFTEKDVTTLHALSSLIAVALNNILANEQIQNLSRQLKQDNIYLSEEIKSNYNFEEIIGESLPLQEVFKKTVQVAHVDSTVLILGETGTGKELIARAIHNLSSRKSRPLIKINCAALPAQLIESELFGHEKGSFTGATDKRTGKFELADGSTIFLDEIGELPLELQAKLLRVLQEKEIERIGGEKSIKVDVRIIAATNRNLEKEVSAGKFRSDLYYRLHIFPIELPALRERKGDIPLLATFFLRKLSHKLGKKITSISPSAMDELVSYEWPGNIRELEHTIERSMLLATGKTITGLNLSKPLIMETPAPRSKFEPITLASNEKELILKTLKYTKGKIRGRDGAAELLDILPTTLEARMKKLGIKKEFIVE